MRLLFCCDPLSPKEVDPAYVGEAESASAAGLSHNLLDFEALVEEGDVKRALRKVKPPETGTDLAVYRGWMLSPDRYRWMYEGLQAKGIELINSPDAYRHCHWLPDSYPVIEPKTPKSIWLSVEGPLEMDRVMEALQSFGDRPIIVKDFVKSRKHEWLEACFIHSAADRQTVERVTRRFLELQGDSLVGGLVYREFVELEPIGRHPKSGMPLTREHRIFFLDGTPLSTFSYWADMGQQDAPPPLEDFSSVAKRIRSRFFTMDVARRKSGGWIVVELGDGQVAGLPTPDIAIPFYAGLSSRLGHPPPPGP